MKIIRSPKKLQQTLLARKRRYKIALVPTMGYLHAGHLKLVQVARRKAGIVVVSLFVNPTQFGPKEDLSRYPRDEKGDLAKLKAAGVDFVFMPRVSDMYPENFQTRVEVQGVSQGLCGASRPGHFAGVATVVLKLLNIVQPDFAVFGRKDYQQLRVIEAMVRDLNLPVKIVGVDTVREKDGLALSSRNAYLSPEERQIAPLLHKGLQAARQAAKSGPVPAATLKAAFLKTLPDAPNVVADYVDVRDAETLAPLLKSKKGRTLMAIAVFIGKTRLIDNIVF